MHQDRLPDEKGRGSLQPARAIRSALTLIPRRYQPSALTAFVTPGIVVMSIGFLAPLAIAWWTSLNGPQGWSVDAYAGIAGSTLFWRVMKGTFEIALLSSVAALLLGYPLALHMSRCGPRARHMFMILVLIPFWTSILVKSYAFIILFGRAGLLNQALEASFFPFGPLDLIFNRTGVGIAMTHQVIPFVVFPLLTSMLQIDRNIYRAADVMGASPFATFWRVTLPLTLPGATAAFLISFTFGLGAYVTPALLGGRQDLMIANLIDFRLRETLDWPAASAIAITLTAVVCVLIALARRMSWPRAVA